jgi:hypothetical protein
MYDLGRSKHRSIHDHHAYHWRNERYHMKKSRKTSWNFQISKIHRKTSIFNFNRWIQHLYGWIGWKRATKVVLFISTPW